MNRETKIETILAFKGNNYIYNVVDYSEYDDEKLDKVLDIINGNYKSEYDNDTDLIHLYCIYLMIQKDLDKCLEYALKSQSMKPNPISINFIGMIYYRQMKIQEALDIFLDNPYDIVYTDSNIALCYLNLNNKEMALEYFEKFITKAATYNDSQYNNKITEIMKYQAHMFMTEIKIINDSNNYDHYPQYLDIFEECYNSLKNTDFIDLIEKLILDIMMICSRLGNINKLNKYVNIAYQNKHTRITNFIESVMNENK